MNHQTPMSEQQFLASACRGASDRMNAGVAWRDEQGRACRATWIEATGELYLVDSQRHVEVLGTLTPWKLVWAIVCNVPTGDRRVASLRAGIQAAPHDRADIDRYLTEFQRKRALAEARRLDERRSSFVVVALDDLPDPDPPTRTGDYAQADWVAIAAASLEVLAAGIDPLDDAAVWEHAAATLDAGDASWLHSLFGDPILVDRDLSGFVNGMHRTWHMLRAGVTHCVVELA